MGEEGDVAAVGGGFEVEVGVGFGEGGGEGGRGEEGVVEGAEEEGGDGEVWEEGEGAGAGVVVFGAGEAVEGSGVGVVEGADGAESGGGQEGDLVGEAVGFGGGFAGEGAEEAVAVECVAGFLVQGVGAGGEVDGGGDGGGGGDSRWGGAFAEVFEDEVAAEAEADEKNGAGGAGEGVVDDGGEVFGGAAVVGAGEAVDPGAAAPVAPGEGVAPGGVQGGDHGEHVAGVGVAFEAVAEDGEGGGGGVGEMPVEFEEVAVGEVEGFGCVGGDFGGGEEGAENGLGVGVAQPCRGLIGGGEEGHGGEAEGGEERCGGARVIFGVACLWGARGVTRSDDGYFGGRRGRGRGMRNAEGGGRGGEVRGCEGDFLGWRVCGVQGASRGAMTGTLEGGGAVLGECGMLRVEGEEEEGERGL
jgi:hypothetical protein